MKCIGLIGGMSWQSTQDYYRIINETVACRRGGLHSAEILLYSVDFDFVERLQAAQEWGRLAVYLGMIGYNLSQAGADFLVIATNTMHISADEVEDRAEIPLLHIVDVTGKAITDAGIRSISLLGTRFIMEHMFYRDRLTECFGLDVKIPSEEDRETIHHIIYDELCRGNIRDNSRTKMLHIIDQMAECGAQGVILGCTELPMLLPSDSAALPLFNTARIHAEMAAEHALAS